MCGGAFGDRRIATAAETTAIAQAEPEGLDVPYLAETACRFLQSISLTQLRRGEIEAIDFICAIARQDAEFLVRLVEGECEELVRKDLRTNLFAIVKSIARLEGRSSGLLDRVLQQAAGMERVETLILEIRTG